MIQAQIFVDKDELIGSEPLYIFIVKFLLKQHIMGATALQGKMGYGDSQHLNRPDELFSFDETPIIITCIDEDDKVITAIKGLRKVYKGGFISTHPVDKW
jgi:PII-like signaling protein